MTTTVTNELNQVTVEVVETVDHWTITITQAVGVPSTDGIPIGYSLQVQGNGSISWGPTAGGGDLLAINNLSDLVDPAIARTNLGVEAKQAKLNFSYGDVTTQVIYRAIAGQRITRVEVGFDTAFNVSSTISVGDSGNDQRLLDTGQNNPLVAGIYSSHPFYKYIADTDIILTIQAGVGATQGVGTVIVYFD